MRAILVVFLLLLTPISAIAQSDLGTMKTLKTERVLLHYPERFQKVVPAFLESTEAASERAQTTLGLETWDRVDVWLLPKVADYYHIHKRPVRSPSWAAGLSLSDQSVIIVAHGSMGGAVHDIHKTVQHELAHVGIDRAKRGAPIPRWFHEGFAVWFADEWTHERSDRLTQAAGFGRLKTFERIELNFPSHQLSASLAYDQSFHFVRWLRTRYGETVYADILQQMPEKSFDDAFKKATGVSLALAEAQWKSDLDEGTSLWSILRDSGIVFFGASMLFIVAFLIRRKQNKKRIEAMADEPGRWTYDESRYPLPGAQTPD